MSRANALPGSTQRIKTGWGRVYVTVNEDEGEPIEVFVTTGQSGGLYNSQAEALGKTISNALQAGANPYELADDLVGIRSDKIATDNNDEIYSIPDAVGVALYRHIEQKFAQPVKES